VLEMDRGVDAFALDLPLLAVVLARHEIGEELREG
jgi:hypothetical protein